MAAVLIVKVVRQKSLPALLFLIPAAFAAVGYSAVDSPWLQAMDLSVMALSVSFSCFAVASGGPIFTGVAGVFTAIFTGTYLPIFGAIDLFCYDLSYKGLISAKQKPLLAAICKGAVIAAPLLLVFTGLFCAADPKFAYLVTHLLNFNIADAFVDTAVVTSLTAGSAGILRTLGLISNDNPLKNGPRDIPNTDSDPDSQNSQDSSPPNTTNASNTSNLRASLNVPDGHGRMSIQDHRAEHLSTISRWSAGEHQSKIGLYRMRHWFDFNQSTFCQLCGRTNPLSLWRCCHNRCHKRSQLLRIRPPWIF